MNGLANKWYLNTEVPTSPKNKSLGLLNIRVYKANENQAQYGIVCNCILELVCGHITVTVGRSKNDPNLLYVAAPGQSKYMDQNTGEVKYYENVLLNFELKAQVLKYIESLIRKEV